MTWGIFKTDSVSDTVKKLQEKLDKNHNGELDSKEETILEELEDGTYYDGSDMLGEASDRHSSSYQFTHKPGDEESEKKLADLKQATKGSGNRVVLQGRLGKNNPNAHKYSKHAPRAEYDDKGKRSNGDVSGKSGYHSHQRIQKADAAHHDVYVYQRRESTEFSLFSEKELDMLISEANNANMTAGAWINDFLHAQQRLMASKGMGGKDAKALALAAYYNHQQAKGKKPAIEEGRMNLDAKEIKHVNLKDKRNDAEIMEPRAQGEKAFVAQHTLIVTDEPNKDGTPNGADKLSATKGPKGQGAGKYDAKEKLGNQGITSKKGEFSEETCSTGPTATGDKAGEIVDTTPQEKKSANKKTYGKFKQEIGHEIK